jgi:signal transduction histidine kinase
MSELLINIAHQWRQPLNAIGMIAQSIRDDFQYKELTNESLDSSTKMIMEELIKLSTTIKTITDGHFKDEKRHEINVSQAVMIGINAMKNQLASNNISLETKIEDDILALGSFNIIIQAIITVITNSLEIFIERKIKDRYIKVETIKDTTNNKVIISIEDNGGGIDKELIDKIFDPYFTTKFKSRGKGMSLYLVKTMIERKMEGSIRIRNTYVGVEFIIEVCCYGS